MTDSLTERRSARILLLDDADRLLLFECIDPWVPETRFWLTPGGGVEAGETLEQAARRELHEETGLGGVELGAAVWVRRGLFTFGGETVDQRESFFLARVPSWEVDTTGFNALEQRSLLGHRWWTVQELQATSDTMFPTALPQLLEALLRDGPAAQPIDVGR